MGKFLEERLATGEELKDLVESELQEVNDLIFDFSSEERIREAGYSPSQAEQVAMILADRKIKIGEMFECQGRTLVLTPFKTVVPAQEYLYTIQNRLIETLEEQQKYLTFTKLSSFDLIKLAFRRFFPKRK